MTMQTIEVGTAPNDGTGDTLRDAGQKINENFGELFGGNAFPASPSAGDRYYRTDRNIEYYYDGARWLSTQLFEMSLVPGRTLNPNGATQAPKWEMALPFGGLYDVFVLAITAAGYLGGGSDWTVALKSVNAITSAATVVASVNLVSAGGGEARATAAANVVLPGGTQGRLEADLVQNSGAVNGYVVGSFSFRLIG